MQIDLGSGFQIDIVALLALGLAGWGTYIARRADRKADEALKPVVEIEVEALEPHWWTVTIEARNRADYGLDGVSLQCVRPDGGLLMVPAFETNIGDVFQIRRATSTAEAKPSIPFRLALAPKGGKEQIGGPPEFEEDRKSAWLYLPTIEAASFELKLVLRTREHTPRDFAYVIKRDLPALPHARPG